MSDILSAAQGNSAFQLVFSGTSFPKRLADSPLFGFYESFRDSE
jgi:hypothetical protein